jgi:molybdopterin synthase catalytic subunit
MPLPDENKTECVIETGLHVGPVAPASLDWPGGCGAEAVFVGRTRGEQHKQFGPLVRLEYEVYEPMAARLLEQLARDAAKRYGCHAIRFLHSQGTVAPGEASVVIQVATPHRGEAFDACRYLIERLKHELPIWKREIWQRGQTYVKGCAACAEGKAAVRN